MTLLDDTAVCPGWKKSKYFLDMNPNVIIETGADKTGNLLSLANYEECVRKYKNSIDLVTADGGFDFSTDFNKQECLALNLIIAEVMFALSIQKKGGHFVLKIFDMFSKMTIDLLYLLCACYEEVYIMKPNTSRVANSEKYVICKRFKCADSAKFIERFIELYPRIGNGSAGHEVHVHEEDAETGDTEDPDDKSDKSDKSENPKSIVSLLSMEHDAYFLTKIEDINAIFGQQQIENILTTISMISCKNSNDKLENIKRGNLQKCIAWCERYGIPHYRMMQSTNIFLGS